MLRNLLLISSALLVFSCLETQSSKGYKHAHTKPILLPEHTDDVDSNTVFSIFGNPLPKKKLSKTELKKRKEALQKAEINYQESPNEEKTLIWLGRRQANLGLYYEAIKTFSTGLEKFPHSYKLFRHRAQHYITIRQFDLALEDLLKAAFYSRPAANETEEDDLANSYALPLSNIKYNIYFNLGMAYYLKGNYDKSISAFKTCLTYADNYDLKSQIIDWFYLTYRKLGNDQAANELIETLDPKNKPREYMDNYNRVMVYKNLFNYKTVLSYAENKDNSLSPTLAYGIGEYLLLNGDIDQAQRIFEQIISNHAWDTYDYLATEVAIKNLRNL